MKSANELAYEAAEQSACETYHKYCLAVETVEEKIAWGNKYGIIYAHLPELMAKACDAAFVHKVAELKMNNAFERLSAQQREREMYGAGELTYVNSSAI